MQHYQDVVLDRAGNVVIGATVTITNHLTGLPVTTYTDVNGTIANTSVMSDTLGTFSFYIDTGRYDLIITKNNLQIGSYIDVFINVYSQTSSINNPIFTGLLTTDSILASGDISASSLNGGQIAGLRNRIINGNFGVNQRGVTGTVTLAAGAYGHDRWKAGASGCTYTFATALNVTTLTISAGTLIQVIEGINLQSYTYTLSWTGTATGKIGAGALSASGITGTAVGGTNLNIEFSTGTLSKVQFEEGIVNSAFEKRPYGMELALCQRYYWQQTGVSFTTGFYRAGTTSLESSKKILPVPMRITPNCTAASIAGTVYTNGSSAAVSTLTAIAGDDIAQINIVVVTAASAQGLPGQLALSSTVTASAEL